MAHQRPRASRRVRPARQKLNHALFAKFEPSDVRAPDSDFVQQSVPRSRVTSTSFVETSSCRTPLTRVNQSQNPTEFQTQAVRCWGGGSFSRAVRTSQAASARPAARTRIIIFLERSVFRRRRDARDLNFSSFFPPRPTARRRSVAQPGAAEDLPDGVRVHCLLDAPRCRLRLRHHARRSGVFPEKTRE